MTIFNAADWWNDVVTSAYLFGYERECERQVSAGEEHDQDRAVRAGKSLERKVEKIIGPNPSTPTEPPHD